MKLDIVAGLQGEPVLYLIAEGSADQFVLESIVEVGRKHALKLEVDGPSDRRVDTLKLYYPPLP